MIGYNPLEPGCACWECWGCNKLELQGFNGLAFCTGSDNENKRVDRKSNEIIEQCKMIMAGLADKMKW